MNNFETFMADVFGPSAAMKPEHKDEDPFQSEEYAKFVESMIPHCRCAANYRPCDGVLAGGLCDEMTDEVRREHFESEDDEQL